MGRFTGVLAQMLGHKNDMFCPRLLPTASAFRTAEVPPWSTPLSSILEAFESPIADSSLTLGRAWGPTRSFWHIIEDCMQADVALDLAGMAVNGIHGSSHTAAARTLAPRK